jgi:hypothetical protein
MTLKLVFIIDHDMVIMQDSCDMTYAIFTPEWHSFWNFRFEFGTKKLYLSKDYKKQLQKVFNQ